MAKNPKAKTAAEVTKADDLPTGEAAPTTNTAEGTAPTTETKVPLAKMRGPKGVPESATIKVLLSTNPKRPGSHAHDMWGLYVDGMTVGAFCDAMDKLVHFDGKSAKGMGTPALVYDSSHGFISIEGYTVPGGVIVAKPKAPPKPKAEKKASGDPGKTVATTAPAVDTATAAAEVEAATTEEEV